MRSRTIAEARADGTLFIVRTPGTAGGSLCFPSAETRAEAVAGAVYWLRQWGKPVPLTLEVWKTDGVIGAQLLSEPTEEPTTVQEGDPHP